MSQVEKFLTVLALVFCTSNDMELIKNNKCDYACTSEETWFDDQNKKNINCYHWAKIVPQEEWDRQYLSDGNYKKIYGHEK